MPVNWKPTAAVIIPQAIEDTSTTQKLPLGTIVTAEHATYGVGEFIYLLGVLNTVVGLGVTYHPSTFQTTVMPNTANLGQPVAWAMSVNVAAQYGFYQIGGVVTAKKTAVAVSPNTAVHISGTAGRVMPAATSGKQVLGARFANVATVTSTTSTVLISVNRPHLQGRVT